jgi:hypothetical protein
MEKVKKPIYKKWWFWVLSFFVAMYILAIFVPKPENIQQKTEPTDSVDIKVATIDSAKLKENFINDINKHIDYLKSVGRKSNKRIAGEPLDITNKLEEQQLLYLQAVNSEYMRSKEGKKLLNEYKKCLIDAMEHNYEQARIVYASKLSDALFKDNVEVNLVGVNNDHLIFTGAIFTNNKNKLQFKQEMEKNNLVSKMRFKKLSFRWYLYDDGTTWTYKTLKDNELAY